jgi:hypothetical protein
MKSGRSSGRPRRRLSIPLLALVVLIVVVALGSFFASRRDQDPADKSHSLGARGSIAGPLLASEVVDTG